eukprot:SAG11_NODE_14735_length_601_cov_1.466135_1_plen_42_part_01
MIDIRFIIDYYKIYTYRVLEYKVIVAKSPVHVIYGRGEGGGG